MLEICLMSKLFLEKMGYALGQWALGNGHWAGGIGQGALGKGHWARGIGQGALGKGHWE